MEDAYRELSAPYSTTLTVSSCSPSGTPGKNSLRSFSISCFVLAAYPPAAAAPISSLPCQPALRPVAPHPAPAPSPPAAPPVTPPPVVPVEGPPPQLPVSARARTERDEPIAATAADGMAIPPASSFAPGSAAAAAAAEAPNLA